MLFRVVLIFVMLCIVSLILSYHYYYFDKHVSNVTNIKDENLNTKFTLELSKVQPHLQVGKI